MVIPHHGLRVSVLRHHLHLAVAVPPVQKLRHDRPPQIVRRNFTYTRELTPVRDYPLHVPRAQGLVEDGRTVVRVRLEQRRIVSVAVQGATALVVQPKIVVYRLLNVFREWPDLFPAPFDLALKYPPSLRGRDR